MVLDSQGAQSQLCVEPGVAPHTFNGSSEPYEFINESLALTSTLSDTDGIRGTRSHQGERTRETQRVVAGTILLHPSPLDLDLWLPRILGTPESGDTFALSETLPAFGVLIDRVEKRFQYTDCYVNKATFRSQAAGFLELELDIIGTEEIEDTAYPTLTLGVTDADLPYVHPDCSGGVTLVSSARETNSVEIIIDNQLEPRFVNALATTSITPQNRIVMLNTVHPFTSAESDLYSQSVAGSAGSIVYTNGAVSTTFTFAKLQVPAESPAVGGKTAIPLTLNMISRMSGSTRELVVTNDSAL